MAQKFTKLVERLEDLIVASPGIPLTPWVLVNGDKLLPLMDRIRECLPDEIRMATQVLERRNDLLEEARHHAVSMVEEAQERSQSLLSESELMKAVQEEANRVRQQMVNELEALRVKTFEECESLKAAAYQEAKLMRNQAEVYAEGVLQALESQVNELHQQLAEGQHQLRNLKQQAAPLVEPSPTTMSALPPLLHEPTNPVVQQAYRASATVAAQAAAKPSGKRRASKAKGKRTKARHEEEVDFLL